MKILQVLGGLFLFTAGAWAQAPDDRAAKWEKEIAGIEKRQADKPPEKGAVLFAGASSIRLWDLGKSFPEWKAVNSGFGGSEIRDSTLFAKRVITKHEPKAIVFYAGDNDLNSGRTPEQALEDFKAFVKAIHAELPKTGIHYIAIKASIARWKQFETQKKANAMIRDFCATDKRLSFIDVVPDMLGADGKPKEDLFVKDGLHLSPKGYELWSALVKKAVK